MKKILTLIVVLIILLSFGTQSLAAINEIPGTIIRPMYTNILYLGATLEIDSLGIATCSGTITQNISEGSCELVMKMQKLDTDKSWDTIATWTKEGLGRSSDTQYRAVSRGTYRIYVTGKVYNSSGTLIETQTAYSVTKTY